ncbi:hypothetical protein K438DRAFT_1949395 [Mycena galopus ATCC 62051]|nr:hypothetical protein K438DRAFT_1949395 [Mycena galopus ATCC 62051]
MEWNLHPISGWTTNDRSPADMRFLGQTMAGVYKSDPLDGIQPETINRYHGVSGPARERRQTQTGAGHASDDDSESDGDDFPVLDDVNAELENRIGKDQEENIRHAPIKVAHHESPFDNAEQEGVFIDLLENVFEENGLPEDYGVCEEEWDQEDYPEIEVIRPGTRGKEISVVLTRDVWFPRALRWAQALDAMSDVLIHLET